MKTVCLYTVPLTLLIALFFGCDKNDDAGTGPVPSDTEAYTALESAMFAMFNSSIQSTTDLDRVQLGQVNEMYRRRAATNPSDATANFGAALTEVFGAYTDADFKSMVKDLEGAGTAGGGGRMFPFFLPVGPADLKVRTDHMANGLAKMLTLAVTDPPSLARIQTVLKTKFVPRLEYALERLAVVEQNPAFEFGITGKMQGDSRLAPLYLDLTEVYLIDAMVRGLKAAVDQFLVFDFQLQDYSTKSLVAGLQPGSTNFFYLASDGQTRARGIKTNLTTMFLRLKSAADFLLAETDNQNDDIIKRGTGGVAIADLQSIRDGIATVETVFTKPQTVRLTDADTDGNDYSFTVTLGAFYDNPPQNPKTQWLPAYTVDTTAAGKIVLRWTQQDYASFTFPDPTFSGVFSGMTNDMMKRILHIDEAFGWRLDCYVYDQGGTLSPTTTLRLFVGGVEEPAKYRRYSYESPYSKDQWFLVNSGNSSPAFVRLFSGASEIALAFSSQPVVRLKSSDYVSVDATIASQTISAIPNNSLSSPCVDVVLNNWATYTIERRTTGSFATIDTVDAYSYLDCSVVRGTTYEYRARSILSRWSYGGIRAVREQNYTNTVSVTVP